jgi:cytochrome c553
MNGIAWKIALLALLVSIAPVIAGEQGAVVRNCTWCHGTGAQGYMVAPRLAGQRPLYLLNQIRDFHAHTRDNPFSRQYMWGAVAALGPQAARDLADYFATIPPRPANDGDKDLATGGRGHLYGRNSRGKHRFLLFLSRFERRGCMGYPPSRRSGLFLFEGAT